VDHRHDRGQYVAAAALFAIKSVCELVADLIRRHGALGVAEEGVDGEHSELPSVAGERVGVA
jgi:hypothetical protein